MVSEPMEDVEKFKKLSSMFVSKRSQAGLILSISHAVACNWSRREISLRTKGRVYQAVVRSILRYGRQTWPVRVAEEGMLEAYDNDSILRILYVRHRGCVPTVELRHRDWLTSILTLLVQRRLPQFGHAARSPEGELIKDLLLPTLVQAS